MNFKARQYHISDDLKCAFIDHILARWGNSVIIGHEMMYGSCEQFADLVLLHNGFTYAIEIKSNADSLYRIDNQIKAYRKVFNYVIVVCGERYKTHLKQSLPLGVGIVEINHDLIVKTIRRPKRETSNLDKKEMLYSIRTSYLARKADFPIKHRSAFEIRAMFENKRASYIQAILYEYWSLKLGPAYDCFISNRGGQTLPNDLASFATLRVVPNA